MAGASARAWTHRRKGRVGLGAQYETGGTRPHSRRSPMLGLILKAEILFAQGVLLAEVAS